MTQDKQDLTVAHWFYKEADSKLHTKGSVIGSKIPSSFYLPNDMEDRVLTEDRVFKKYSSLKVGHLVLRVEGSNLLVAVIVRYLLVAAGFVLAAFESVVDKRSSSQRKRREAYARLYKKVSDEWWCEPGHEDWSTCLEKYTLCRDGLYHNVIDLSKAGEIEYWDVVSSVSEGKKLDSVSLNSTPSWSSPSTSGSMEAGINNNVCATVEDDAPMRGTVVIRHHHHLPPLPTLPVHTTADAIHLHRSTYQPPDVTYHRITLKK
nr:beta-grasp domain-containing protein [Tanacetum cinerariifolium]